MCHTAKQTAVGSSHLGGGSHRGRNTLDGKPIVLRYRNVYAGTEMLLGKLKRLSLCFPLTKV